MEALLQGLVHTSCAVHAVRHRALPVKDTRWGNLRMSSVLRTLCCPNTGSTHTIMSATWQQNTELLLLTARAEQRVPAELRETVLCDTATPTSIKVWTHYILPRVTPDMFPDLQRQTYKLEARAAAARAKQWINYRSRACTRSSRIQ